MFARLLSADATSARGSAPAAAFITTKAGTTKTA